MLIEAYANGQFDWVKQAACAALAEQAEKAGLRAVDLFFVEAGHVIDDETLKVCQTCPVRRDCLIHAYDTGSASGYFGGMSPGQRRSMPLEAALEALDAGTLGVTASVEE